ncbi:hypothetical protein Hanom_Chr17g01529081 [Helianthus anomalus]
MWINPIRWMRIRNEWIGFHLGYRVRIRSIAAIYWISLLIVSLLLSFVGSS